MLVTPFRSHRQRISGDGLNHYFSLFVQVGTHAELHACAASQRLEVQREERGARLLNL